jgi:hypothetical protein
MMGVDVHHPVDAPHGFTSDALATSDDAFEFQVPSGRLERETPTGPAGR